MTEQKQIVIITGTNSGFGLLTAVELIKQGFFVIATMRNTEKKNDLTKLIQKNEIDNYLDIQPLDVTDDVQIERLKHYVISKYGHIDILINNAGYCLGGVVEELSITEWKRQFDTNFFGMVAVTKAFLPLMRQQRKGKIINVGSISGQVGFPGMAPYTSSKFAVAGFSESLRLELLPFNVKVSLVEPGSYQTKIWEKSLGAIQLDSTSDYYPFIEKIYSLAKNSAANARDPREVIEIIVQICQSPRPRFRYMIGRNTKATVLLKKIIPWSWIEWYVRKQL